MKDVPVREKLSGFVPYAGVGTGFSRRAFTMLEQTNPGGQIFNEYSMTEVYAMSLRMKQLGLRSIFVGVTLADDKSKWYVPLIKRPGFISNWAYFPMDFHRSVRQKTRWIIGISLQEWEMMGWRGGIKIIENLVKDRKVFVASAASLFTSTTAARNSFNACRAALRRSSLVRRKSDKEGPVLSTAFDRWHAWSSNATERLTPGWVPGTNSPMELIVANWRA